jgi:hypothetical protein
MARRSPGGIDLEVIQAATSTKVALRDSVGHLQRTPPCPNERGLRRALLDPHRVTGRYLQRPGQPAGANSTLAVPSVPRLIICSITKLPKPFRFGGWTTGPLCSRQVRRGRPPRGRRFRGAILTRERFSRVLGMFGSSEVSYEGAGGRQS